MRLSTFAVLLSLLLPSTTLAQSKVTRVDYVFLVDVSASMVGQAGHTDIFPAVKRTIQEFVSQIPPGSQVFFYPFAEKIREVRRFEIRQPEDAVAANSYTDALIADGQATAVFNSIEQALEDIKQNRKQYPEERTVVFFVYTDGDDNVSKKWNLAGILEHFKLERGKNDWIFFTELGLPPNDEKDKLFDVYKDDGIIHIGEKAGKLHPIIYVETVIPYLNFGNLKQTTKSTRIEKFIVRSKVSLPANYSITIEPEFEDLKSQGAYAQLAPIVFPPSENVNLELSLVNSEGMKNGGYTGRLNLLSGDPFIKIVPSKIEVSFLFEPERIVEVFPTNGESFPPNFGDLKLDRDQVVESSKSFGVRFNAQAVRSGERLKIRILEDPANPQHLEMGTDLSLGQIKGDEGSIGPEGRQLDLVFKAKPGFSTGEYHGKILFEGENLRVEGSGLHDVKEYPNAKGLDWSIYLKSAPWTWWMWILAFICILLVVPLLVFALYCLKEGVGPSEGIETLSSLWFPVLEGELEVIEPEAKQGVHNLKGRKLARVGQGGEILPEVDASFRIEPDKYLGKRAFKITAIDDSMVKVDGSPIFAEHIFDSQVIELGKAVRVKIRYNNARLPKID